MTAGMPGNRRLAAFGLWLLEQMPSPGERRVLCNGDTWIKVRRTEFSVGLTITESEPNEGETYILPGTWSAGVRTKSPGRLEHDGYPVTDPSTVKMIFNLWRHLRDGLWDDFEPEPECEQHESEPEAEPGSCGQTQGS